MFRSYRAMARFATNVSLFQHARARLLPPLKPGGSTGTGFADLLGRFPRQAGVALVPGIPIAFCELLAPDLAQFQADLATSNVQLVLASPEDAESNRELALEHGLTCPILLMPDDG